MAAPWEKYAAADNSGPWAKYQQSTSTPADPSLMDQIKQGAGNIVAGAVRGAGSIGATILTPVDTAARALGVQNEWIGRTDRRQAMDEGLKELGANPESLAYKAGKLGAEVAGTAGVGGALANGLRAAAPGVIAASPRLAQLASAIESGGFMTGAPAATNALGKVADLGVRMVGGGITGAASAGLVNPNDAKIGAAVGGALPVAATVIGKAATSAGRAIRGGEVAPEVKTLAGRAQDLGIDVPADRIVNSKPMNALAASLDYVPFSGRAATEAKMQSQLNRALTRTFGQDSDNVTASLRNASGDLGAKFDNVLQSNTVKMDNQFLADLGDAEAKAVAELAPDQASIIKKQIDTLLEKGQSGAIDGQAAYNIKKTLDRIGKRNTPEAYYALDLKNQLMDALNRSLGPQEAAKFAATRQQYGNMLALEKLAKNGAEGDISIGRLANMKNIKNPDLQELADISAQFLKSREGMHGAAQRAVAGMAAGGLAGIPAVAGMAAGGRVTNMLLNSDFARNAVMGNSNPAIENALTKLLPLTYRAAPALIAPSVP